LKLSQENISKNTKRQKKPS